MSNRKVYRTLAKESIVDMMTRLAQGGLNPRRYVTIKSEGKKDRTIKTEKVVRLKVFADQVEDKVTEKREVWLPPTIKDDSVLVVPSPITEEAIRDKLDHFGEVFIINPDVKENPK